MRALVLIALIVALAGFGCAKKEAVQTGSMEEPTQEVVSESVTVQSSVPAAAEPSMPSTEASTTQAVQADSATQAASAQVSDEKIEKNKKIQTALTNAGFYKSSIDGKIGPKTKKAIREFQEAKGLNVDGKVGPKTWAELEKYLTGPEPAAEQQ